MRKLLIVLVLLLSFSGFVQAQDSVNIILAAYTTPREAYAQIIPLVSGILAGTERAERDI